MKFNAFDFDPTNRFLLTAEAEGQGGDAGQGAGDGGAGNGADAGSKDGGAAGDKGDAEGAETAWRETITDPEHRKLADRFNSPADAIKAVADLRKRESTAIRIPGKDAKPEEIAAYRKAMDIPDDPKGYTDAFAKPEHIDEATFKSEGVQANLSAFAAAMHDAGVSKAGVKAAWDFYAKLDAAAASAAVEADKAYAEQSKAALEKEWGADYKQNDEIAQRAFGAVAEKTGIPVAELREIETKEGRFLLDDPRFKKLFATIGREMQEGTLGPTLTADQKEQAEDELRGIREKIAEAQNKGDNRRANELYQKEQGLIAKIKGNGPIVGSQGRAA